MPKDTWDYLDYSFLLTSRAAHTKLIMFVIYNGKKVGHNGPEETTFISYY